MSESDHGEPELDNNVLDVLSSCESLFSRAYRLHLQNPESDFVRISGDSESVRLLYSFKDGRAAIYDLRRPHLRSIVSDDIAFWLDEVRPAKTPEDRPLRLAAKQSDPLQFYSTDEEGDPTDSIGPDESLMYALRIHGSSVLPAPGQSIEHR